MVEIHQSSGSSSEQRYNAVPQSYLPASMNFSKLTPRRLLNSFIHELENHEEEHVEHFKYKQDLERKLTFTSVIGLGFGVMGVVFGISSTIWISLIDGANVTILYGWIITAFFSVCVVLSLSEIISKYPTSGGVYHFSAILSNEKYSLVSSWFTGWFLLIGNWTYAVSIMFAGSQFILSMFGIKDVYYKEDAFLVLGVFFILLSFCGIVNFKFSKYLDKINSLCILWSVSTVLTIDVLLIFFAKKTNSIQDILTKFDNTRSGWPDPLAFLIGFQSPSFTLSGYGMIFSMTDEVKDPEINMPKGTISAILISSLTGLIFIIPILTILPELTLLLDETPEIMPIDLIFKFSTESYIISFLLGLLLIGTVLFQAIAGLTTASRSTYAFARDGGLPFKQYWVEVDSVEESLVPKNALFLSMFVCGTLSLLSLFSESAFNAFMGSSVISLALANGIPILCLMINKRQKIKGAAFRMRGIGWVVNALSIFWVVLLFFILCLPPVIKDITWYSMNYAIVVIIAFVLFASLGYRSWGRLSFNGPQIDYDYFELQDYPHPERKGQAVAGDDSFVVDDADTTMDKTHLQTSSSNKNDVGSEESYSANYSSSKAEEIWNASDQKDDQTTREGK